MGENRKREYKLFELTSEQAARMGVQADIHQDDLYITLLLGKIDEDGYDVIFKAELYKFDLKDNSMEKLYEIEELAARIYMEYADDENIKWRVEYENDESQIKILTYNIKDKKFTEEGVKYNFIGIIGGQEYFAVSGDTSRIYVKADGDYKLIYEEDTMAGICCNGKYFIVDNGSAIFEHTIKSDERTIKIVDTDGKILKEIPTVGYTNYYVTYTKDCIFQTKNNSSDNTTKLYLCPIEGESTEWIECK